MVAAIRIEDYPNIKKIVDVLNDNPDARSINVFLGINKEDNSLLHLSALKRRDNTISISGILHTRYFEYTMYLDSTGEFIVSTSQIYEPFFISLAILNSQILESEEYGEFDQEFDRLKYNDLDFYRLFKKGLEQIIFSGHESLYFDIEEERRVIIVNSIHFFSIKSEQDIWKVTFVNSIESSESASIYYDTNSRKILSGYVSQYSPIKAKYGKEKIFNIIRDTNKALELIKTMRF